MRVLLPLVLVSACSSCAPNGTAAGAEEGGKPSPVKATAGSKGGPQKAAAPAAPRTAADSALTEEMARSYFAGGPAAEAARRFALEDFKAARAGFAAALKSAKDDEQKGRLELMIALCDAGLDHWEPAAAGFARAARALPRIADWVRYQGARASYFAHDMDEALSRARAVDPKSIVGNDAALLIGDALRGKEEWDKAARHYRDYLERKRAIRRTEARFRLAEAYEKLGRPVADALRIYRRIDTHAPTSPWGEQAEDRIAALVKKLPKAKRKRWTSLSAEQLLTRGMAYARQNRNKEAEKDLAAALEAGLSPAKACVAAYHRAQTFWNRRDRTRAAPLYDEALKLCKKAGNIDLQVKSVYQAGRSYDRTDDTETSIARFALLEKSYPDHSYADDARLRRVEQYVELGDEEKAQELLAACPKDYPKGDMLPVTLWRLGWNAFKNKDYEEALRWFARQEKAVPIEHHWAREGQPQYWSARALAELGRTEESIAAYEETVHLYPLSYYALLALNRLREEHPKRFLALKKDLAKAPDGYDPKQPAFSFRKRPLWGKPGFLRALEFLKLGLGSAAEAELSRLGLSAPPGRDPVEDPDEQDKLWAMAFLYDAAGQYDKSHWVTRWHVLGYKRSWPVGKNRARWRLAYPLAWHELLARHAKKHGYPTELQLAIVREESAFDPLLESWANAIGLTQMIFPTARRFAKGTGIHVSREALRDPEKNVTIGSNFLAFLWDEFHGRPALVVPSYNAGEGATWRWLEERGDWKQDAWSEEIPYDQTRGYSKRVLASYFAYSYLKDGTIPEMPNDIPKELRKR